MSRKVLVVDDEKLIVKGIRFSLEQDGMEVDCAYDGEEAVEKAKDKKYDIILLDLMLPKMDGLEVCQQIREFSNVPIVMLTAKGEDMDKILGLEYGADDYITKPFSVIELQARVKAFLRRANEYARSMPERENEAGQTQIRIGDLLIDPGNLTVQKRGEGISLTAKEFDILRLLAGNPSRVYTKIQIYESVWDENFLKDENVINVTIRRLREKIEDNPSAPVYIKTVWGIGYKMRTGKAE